VIGGAFVIAEVHVQVGGGSRIAEKGKLVQEAAVFIVVEKIFLDEGKGLACAGTLGDAGEGGAFVGFALSIFGETRASVQAEAGPVENGGCATEESLAIVEGGCGNAVVQEFENGEGERLLLLLRFAPGALSGDQIREERVEAGRSAGGGETVGGNGLAKFRFEPEGCGFDVASDGARAGVEGAFEAVTVFDGPSEGANELDSLGTVG
jgi:hypothetical protein